VEAEDVLLEDEKCQKNDTNRLSDPMSNSTLVYCDECNWNARSKCNDQKNYKMNRFNVSEQKAIDVLTKDGKCLKKEENQSMTPHNPDFKINFCEDCIWGSRTTCADRKFYIISRFNITEQEAIKTLTENGGCQEKADMRKSGLNHPYH